MEPSESSFKFEATAKKEKCDHFQETSTTVAGRNFKFAI